MKIIFLSYFFLFINFGILTSTAGQSVKVMTYNIRLDYEGDNEDNWHQRKRELADYILKEDPDFVGVQEALYHQVAFLEGALRNYKYIGVGRDDGKRAGEFMALFYKADQWTPTVDSTFWLSESPDVPSMGWDAGCFRVCTFGVFENEKGKSIAVFNTHFDHVGKLARQESVAVIKSHIEAFRKKYPTVLIGDFNVEPSDPVYLAITNFLKDSRTATSDRKESFEGTFNGFKITDDFERRIDYIFVDEKKIGVKKYTADIPLTKKGRQLSDHFPIIIELEIK